MMTPGARCSWLGTGVALIVAAGAHHAASAPNAKSPGDAALALDGASGYAFASVVAPDPFTSEATVAAWVYLDELPSAAGHIFHIAGKSGFARDLDLQVEGDDRFHFYVARGAPNTVISQTVVETGRWYRVAATYRRDDAIALYVDAKEEARRRIPGIQRLPNVGPLSMGENFAFPGRKLHGMIDEVSFWSRALGADEIAALRRAPPGPQPDLVASYPFDGDATDRSASRLDARLVGSARLVSPGAPANAAAAARSEAAPAPPPIPRPPEGAPAQTCPTDEVRLDQKTVFGVTPQKAMDVLHAAEQRFVLSENHRGFFEEIGLKVAPAARGVLTLRFRPDGDAAVERPPCRPDVTPKITIAGTLTAELAGGVTYRSPATLDIQVLNGQIDKAFANGAGTAPGHADAQLLWQLSPQVNRAYAILHGRLGGDAFWRAADPRAATGTPADAAAIRVRDAFLAMGGRKMRCSTRPAKSTPRDWAPPQYEGTLPPVSVPAITLPDRNAHRNGSIILQVDWPKDPKPATFELTLEPAAKTKTIRGYRLVGWSSEATPLPAELTPTFTCDPHATARWWTVTQAFPNDQGTLLGSGSFMWGPGCDRYVSCSF